MDTPGDKPNTPTPITQATGNPRGVKPRRGIRQGVTAPPTAEELADVREKERKCFELALAGATYDKIAEMVGYADASGAWKAMDRVIRRTQSKAVEEYRELMGARYERLWQANWRDAILTGTTERPLSEAQVTAKALATKHVLAVGEKITRLFALNKEASNLADALRIPVTAEERRAELTSMMEALTEARARNAVSGE